jgi:hypothetical protein
MLEGDGCHSQSGHLIRLDRSSSLSHGLMMGRNVLAGPPFFNKSNT